MLSAVLPREKPRYRGVSHTWAFFGALASTVPLALAARSVAAWRAAIVFGACLALLFGISTLYHRIDWTPAGRQRMRRLDHAAIFVLIAGGYTPLFSLFPLNGSYSALWIIWIGAALGIAKSILWPGSPKWVIALLCVALGWAVAGQVIASAAVVGWLASGMLVAAGTTYSIGAIVYALKRPDPLPKVFGYHEVFHAIVIAASVCLWLHVWFVLHAG